jgi:fumarylpyruvate hydrolase
MLATTAVAAEPRLVIPAPSLPTIAVVGTSRRFPVRRLYCLGRNYAEHAREMGDDPNVLPPFFFMKPADAIVPDDRNFPYPARTVEVEHEIEMVVGLKAGGVDIPESKALECVFGYGVGLDMTRRDLQDLAKELRRPWEASKSFDHSAPCGPLHPVAMIGHPRKGRIWVAVNGQTKQEADLAHLIWSVPRIISELSSYFALAAGDVIFTGTPAGVAVIKRGDNMRGGVEGVGEIDIDVV